MNFVIYEHIYYIFAYLKKIYFSDIKFLSLCNWKQYIYNKNLFDENKNIVSCENKIYVLFLIIQNNIYHELCKFIGELIMDIYA